MSANEDAERADRPPADERRRQERLAPQPGDWESLALSRVAGRVEALSHRPAEAAAGPASGEFGWEARVIANLRRHLKPPGGG
jgi:hypothetical protein